MIPEVIQGLTAVAEIAIIVNKRKEIDFIQSHTMIRLPGAHYRSEPCDSQQGNKRILRLFLFYFFKFFNKTLYLIFPNLINT